MTTFKTILLNTALVVISSSVQAKGGITVGAYIKYCSSKSGESLAACTNYSAAMFSSYTAANAYLVFSRKTKPLFCMPKAVLASNRTLTSAFIDYLRHKKIQNNESADVNALFFLQNYYPCK